MNSTVDLSIALWKFSRGSIRKKREASFCWDKNYRRLRLFFFDHGNCEGKIMKTSGWKLALHWLLATKWWRCSVDFPVKISEIWKNNEKQWRIGISKNYSSNPRKPVWLAAPFEMNLLGSNVPPRWGRIGFKPGRGRNGTRIVRDPACRIQNVRAISCSLKNVPSGNLT